jgi:hypothetical protein
MTLDEAMSRCSGWSIDPESGGVVTIDGVDIQVSDPEAGWSASGGNADQRAVALVICREWL